MTVLPAPPRLSRALLEWASRRLRTPELAEDAVDLFVDKADAEGERLARQWYRRQTRAALTQLFALRPDRHRNQRRVSSVSGLTLDAKIGFRMLARYPGLTMVAGLAMAFAIFVGAGLFEFINQTLPSRDLPLPHGERIVGLRFWDRSSNAPADTSFDDLRDWREQLSAVDHIGGFRSVTRNLLVGDSLGGPVEIALMSPTGFEVAGVAARLGRVLAESDAALDAASVVVIGHRTWQTHFNGSSDAVGQTVQLGPEQATVVGVMPDGFGFPISHDLWMPLRIGSATGTKLTAFGRLDRTTPLETAQAEAGAVLARGADRDPGRDAQLALQVLPYRESLFDRPLTLVTRVIFLQLNAFAALFLTLVAANVALLTFARAASREREFLLRTALGAGRARIVTQLFVEALVLALLAAGAGLAATGPGLSWLASQIGEMGGGTPPFWFTASLSVSTAIYATALAVLAAVIAGVLPALKATGQVKHARLGQASAGAGGLRFGGIWTIVVVSQVAVTVVFAGGALLMVHQAQRSGAVDASFPAGDYLTMRVEMDDENAAPASYATRVGEFTRRLAEEPAVAGVAVAERLPLMLHPARFIELDDPVAIAGQATQTAHVVSDGVVDRDLFDVLNVPMVAGRGFGVGDLAAGAHAVIVDEFFVEQVLGGRNAVGRRIRETDPDDADNAGPWLTVVGVVQSLETDRPDSLYVEAPPRPFVYRALDLERSRSTAVRVAVHVPSDPAGLAATVHRIAADVSPTLTLHDVQPLDQIASAEVAFWRLWAQLVVMLSVIALFLSLAGIYAVTSFTVSRRTREIGVRVALGAPTFRVVSAVLRGPATQVCIGVAMGSGVAGGLVWSVTGSVTLINSGWMLLLGVSILAVCALAGLGPARRAMRVEPTEALGASE